MELFPVELDCKLTMLWLLPKIVWMQSLGSERAAMGKKGSERSMCPSYFTVTNQVFDVTERPELAFKIHICSCHSATPEI